jgi:hypothetical protein
MSNETEEKALSRIHIGELDYETDGNILNPFYPCYVVTTSGQLWDIMCQAFTCTENRIREVWNTDRSRFTKREFQPTA